MKTRILILEQQSYWGGAQRVLQTVLDGLRDDIEPLVALPEPGAFGLDLQKRGVETLTYPLGRYRSSQKSTRDMLAFGPRSLACAAMLAREIVRRRIHLVYINGPRCLPAGALAAWMTGRPSLFSLHNTLTRRTDVLLASRGAAWISRIVACSHAAAAPLLRTNPSLASKLQILYPPSELPPAALGPAARPALESSRFVIGMVSRITRAKGQHILLHALGRLGRSDRREIVFLGAPAPGNPDDAGYMSSLGRYAAEQGLERNIKWAGYQADPHPYYEDMDVLAVPSICEEGMPVVILEAFQHGVPVVASASGGIPELVEDGLNGLLVQTGDPDELARALERLRLEPGLHERLSTQAYASVDQRFSKEHYCSVLRELIAELCALRAPAGTVLDWTETRG